MNTMNKPLPKQLLKPRPLRPGDTIAIVSPAAPTREPADAFEQGIALLESLGYRVKLMPNVRAINNYLAGTDVQRLDDLHAAFSDPEVQGILCARGGYGSARLLSQLDFNLIAQNPKVFIGFSDVTSLHIALYQQCGLVGFYGPMLTSNLIEGDAYSREMLFNLISGQQELTLPVANRDPYQCFYPGVAQAPLIGGNLSLLSTLCGTPWQPDTRGHILFIEDWKERYYTLDRQFQQLRLAGIFDNIAGLLLCDFSEIEPEFDLSVADVLRQLTADLTVPVGYGFSVGHGTHCATLPIGTQAEFHSEHGTLILRESPTQA